MCPAPHSTRDVLKSRADQRTVDEAVLESFPASDAPSWTATHAGAPAVAPIRPETPREVRSHVLNDLRALSVEIGERNDQSPRAQRNLSRAADHIAASLLDAGLSVTRIPVPGARGENLEAVLKAASGSRGDIVIGAHYDTVEGSPGADDDASGVAVLLGLARVLRGRRFARAVRLVAFTNEAPPHSRTKTMGSAAYAERLKRQGVHIEGMIALECVGHVRTGALALVGNLRSRHLVREATDAFRTGTRMNLQPVVVPGFLPLASSSDHQSFWKQGWRAAMLTDGGPLRSRRHHTAGDVASVVDPDRMADVVFGLASVVARLAGDAGDASTTAAGG